MRFYSEKFYNEERRGIEKGVLVNLNIYGYGKENKLVVWISISILGIKELKGDL